MSKLPSVGDLVVLPPAASGERTGTVAIVTKAKKLKAGTKLTLLSGNVAFSSERETKPMTEAPDNWTVLTGPQAYEHLKGVQA